MWIANIDLHYYDLIDNIEKFDDLITYKSDIDQYYIVRQDKCFMNLSNIKRFTLFSLDKNSEVIFKSN